MCSARGEWTTNYVHIMSDPESNQVGLDLTIYCNLRHVPHPYQVGNIFGQIIVLSEDGEM